MVLDVVKQNREKEAFNYKKVYKSALRSGASRKLAQTIAETIKEEAYHGMKTSQIYRRIRELLKKEDFKTSIRFSLKEAMRKLGPEGFFFEKFIARILEELGYKVRINQIVAGKCLNYETDVLAERGDVLYIVECKYRNLKKTIVRSQIALANYARYLDIKESSFKQYRLKSMLVTNNKLSYDASVFCRCRGVECFGWRNPKGKGLEKIIEEKKLYPVTILPSFKKNLYQNFENEMIILAKDVLETDMNKFFKRTNIDLKYLLKIKKEAEILINSNHGRA